MIITKNNINLLSIIKLSLCKHVEIRIIKRYMLGSRCMYAIRAIYYASSIISNTDTLNQLNKSNRKHLVNEIVRYNLNDNQGIVQHKNAVIKNLTNQKVPSENVYEPYIEHTNNMLVKYEPNVLTDFRTLNELKTLDLYCKYYGKDIYWIYATLDHRAATFPHATQSNPDFWVLIDKTSRVTYQDDKSGMDMFKHSSKGSLGVVSYDSSGKNIQMTSKPIEINNLITYNSDNLNKLESALKNDHIGQDKDIMKAMRRAHILQKEMSGSSYEDVFKKHHEIQNILWSEIQCHPKFTQSVSFVFLNQVINQPNTEKEIQFSKTFQSKLKPNKMYDLTKREDYNELYTAFIYAGKDLDPQFIQKLHYIHNNGMSLNNNIILLLNQLAKNGIQ